MSLLVTTLLPYPHQACSALSLIQDDQLNQSLPAAAGNFNKKWPSIQETLQLRTVTFRSWAGIYWKSLRNFGK